MKLKFKKTIVSLLTTAMVSMSFIGNMTASGANQSKTFRIYYNVSENSGISEMTSHLIYDYSKVEVKKVVRGNLGGYHGFSQNTYGIMDVSYENTSNIYAAGTLMYVSFDAPESVSKLSDYASYNITSVKNTAGTSLSSLKVSTSTILVGDINQDGEVAANDIVELKKYLNGTGSLTGNKLKAADVDGDLDVDNDDLELLKKYILGIISSFDR